MVACHAPLLMRYRRSVGEVVLPIRANNTHHLSTSGCHRLPLIPLGKLYKSTILPYRRVKATNVWYVNLSVS